MTEHGHNFIREIAEAYRALEMEPQYQAQIRDWERNSKRDGEAIARLELRLMEMSAAQDELTAKLRSVEAERDEAGFRQLEAEDKTANVLVTLGNIQTAVGSAIAAIEGNAKDQIIAMTRAEHDDYYDWKDKERQRAAAFEAEREARVKAEEARLALEAEYATLNRSPEPVSVQPDPTTAPITDSTVGQTAEPIASTVEQSSTEAQEVPHPLPTTVSSADTNSPTIAQSQDATSQDNADSTPHPSQPSGRYSGKRYHEWPYYVSLVGWLAEGGTEEDYTWRPDALASAR